MTANLALHLYVVPGRCERRAMMTPGSARACLLGEDPPVHPGYQKDGEGWRSSDTSLKH